MRYIWPIALLVSIAAAPVSAQSGRYRLNIDARDLTAALTQLSEQAQISIARDGALPRLAPVRVRGRMTAEDALARLLDPLGWEAVRVAPQAYRLRPRAVPVATAPVEEAPPPDIVVTGRKRDEGMSTIPAPVAILRPGMVGGGVVGTTRDVARAVDGLTLTGAGPGADRLFLRGIADSVFNGFSQSPVSVQLDDARIAFDGADPALRLVDVARVEILKGPQGPLYGTGALGGVYRIVTNRPVLNRVEADVGVGLSGVAGGGIGPFGQSVVDVPLIRDRLGLRIVGYGAVDPGWIDDDDGRRNLNRTSTRGARIAFRVAPFGGWLIDASAARQAIDARDTSYVDRADAYRRNVPTAEPYQARLSHYQGAITGPIGPLRLTVATGLTTQSQSQRYDGGVLAPGVPVAIYNDRMLRVVDQEIRVNSAESGRLVWVAGAAFLSTRTEGDLVGLARNGIVTRRGAASREVTEAAVFADGSATLMKHWQLGLGVRVFRAGTRNDSFGIDRAVGRAPAEIGVTPNVSLSYTPDPGRIVYARFATAYRPGGLNTDDGATRRYAADRVRALDLGGRMRLLGGRLGIDGNLFLTRWSDIQSDYLRPEGWIGTRNAGRASIVGLDASVDWQAMKGWRIAAGGVAQRPRRRDDPSRYLPLVPDLSARLAVSRVQTLGGWQVVPRLSAELTSATHLGLDRPGDRRMPPRVIGRFGVVGQSHRLTLALDVDNLTGVRADTLAFGNPFAATTARYYTPYRPRTLTLSANRRL
ncbi:TonB-dependent receptor [Sphingomonas sp. S6]|jgi:iron complex outermembrane receptor protein|uniref:TonB-dependent receptor n=1 Tax=Sphingomonas sp. S6 TaxID=3368600 RepID=UPI000FB3CF83|nr:TonB-dependent receptor [uncultured Sphingomonas sp.]RTL20467.1 MAG: TonB-dependent receptor [Sphingomonadaceae bacterium]